MAARIDKIVISELAATDPRTGSGFIPNWGPTYQLGLPKIREIEYEVFFVDFCFYHDILQPFKAVMYFNFYFFFASFAAIKQLQNAPPHLFFRNRAPSPCPSHGRHRILVGCCVHWFYCGHLWPWPHPSLSEFFFDLISTT